MRLSHEKIVHLSHLLLDELLDDDRVDYHGEESEVRQRIVALLKAELEKDDAVQEAIRRKIGSQKRNVPEGSPEWELLYRKYYEEELAKVKRLRE
ncbi:MAG TPA: DUF507 family protein [Candidatus Polarisedimenticolia bacterium]|jgi:hypothetical protein|nr:DUF507 family protein [Candidatus Polarisedimenticolia bacterium]